MDTNVSDVSSEAGGRNIRIHFVCLGGSKPEDDSNAFLTEAFQALTKAGMSPRWTSERSCLSLKRRSRSELFVLPDFIGEVFDHLRSLHCSIVGPALLLSCLQSDKAIPKTYQPMLSDCMTGIVACCTSVEKPEREKIRDRILSMNGQCEASLSSECTVLITSEVGSRKYKAAVKQKTVAIVTPAWVDTIWKRSHLEVFKAKDDAETFSAFKCPVFKGFVITVSNLRNEQRKSVEQLIKDNGGRYSGEMKQGETTHLVTDSTDSQKYKVAKTWKSWPICIVRTAWLYDSVNRGACFDEEEYLTEGKRGGGSPKRNTSVGGRRQQKCSTPTNGAATSAAVPFPFVDPNSTAMTTIAPEASNMTVMSNVSMGITTSCINNSEFPTLAAPILAALSGDRREHSGDGETTTAEPGAAATTINVAEDPRSPSSTPLKRLRSVNPPAASTSNKGEDGGMPTTPSKRKELYARRTSVAALGSADDVLDQYISEEVQDPNCSFRPNFDLAEAQAHVEREGLSKKLAPQESPSVILERQLNAAVEATGAGTSYYNSPASVDDVRRSLTKHLEAVLGRKSLKRRGSNNTLISNISCTVDSPTTPAAPVRSVNNVAFGGRSLLLSQDTQEENVVVDWDDPNQRRERQRVGGLLKKRNEPTQSLLDDICDGEMQIVSAPEEPPKKAYIFQLTSLSRAERDRCTATIKKLGGSISDMPNYDSNCTHLVAAAPTRNEKLLAGIASGVWVLHISYLSACEAAGRFVDESGHEFGSANIARVVSGLREEVIKLLNFCPRWRQRVQESSGAKAYSGWNVFLMADQLREDGFVHILMAGGAVVTRNAHEAEEGVVTHVILEQSKKPNAITAAAINRLVAGGAKCYKADVIFAYLAGEALRDYCMETI